MGQQSGGGYWDQLGDGEQRLIPLREVIERSRSRLAKAIEAAERVLAHPAFFAILLGAHALWIVLNVDVFPWWTPWDPYPFTLLATVASVEAPFITLMVLMRQHRQRQIAELRSEVELQLSLHHERQASELVRTLDRIEEALGIREDDDEVRERRRAMSKPLNPERVLDRVRDRLEQDESEPQPGGSKR